VQRRCGQRSQAQRSGQACEHQVSLHGLL
jgi:hypothetical protein